MIPVVLLAGDDRPLDKVVESRLGDSGFHVVSAPNGAEALRILREGGRVDLILNDQERPVLGGRELLAERAEHPDLSAIPLVVLAADASANDLSPGTPFLPKPAGRARLLSVIRETLFRSPPRGDA